MGFFDIYRYIDESTPMGRAARVSARVSEPKRAEIAAWLEEHGHAEPADAKQCWYCGERDAPEPVGVLLQKGVAVQHMVSMTVPLPACAGCRELLLARARAAKRLHHVGFVLGLAGVVALLATEGRAPSDWIKAILVGFIMTVFIAGVAGAALGWIAVRASARATSLLRSELDYPLVKKVRQDGWRPM